MAPAWLDDVQRSAEISSCDLAGDPEHDRVGCPVCDVYRYELRRVWDDTQPLIGWCALNPSTADGMVDDASTTRMMRFTELWGGGGMVLRNAFALRARNPKRLREHPDPVGPRNVEFLMGAAAGDEAFTVCAWGAYDSPRLYRVARMLQLMGVELRALGFTKHGQPRHPLYLPYAAGLVPYEF